MATEALQGSKINMIFASVPVIEVLNALEISLPCKKISLSIGPSYGERAVNVIQIVLLWLELMRQRPASTTIPSFSLIWKFLPFVKIHTLNTKMKGYPRGACLREALNR